MSYNLTEICEIRLVLTPAASRFHVALMVIVPILTFAMLAHFFLRRRISILTKRRSRLLVAIVASGIMTSYGAILIMDHSPYACWLRSLLDAVTVPLLVGPLIMRLAQYRAAVALRVRAKYVVGCNFKTISGGDALSRAAKLSTLSQSFKVNGSQDGEGSVTEETATTTTAPSNTYRRALRFCGMDASRTSMEFVARPEFVFLWLIVVMVPYVLFFGIHYAMNPRVAFCTYCKMDLNEIVFYITSLVILIVVGLYIAAPLYKDQPDPLGMLKEFMLVWTVSGSIGVLALLLHAIDPNQLYYPRGEFVWRWILFICELSVMFFQTTYQFIEVRRWRHRTLVLGSGLTAKELFKEIYRDPTLHNLLRAHMQAELNDEALLFLQEVDAWKLLKDGRQRTARFIYDTYLRTGSPNEVNISSAHAEAVMLRCEKGNVNEDVFNECVDEIKGLIVVDVLPRFLESRFYKQYKSGILGTTSPRMAGALVVNVRLDSHSSFA